MSDNKHHGPTETARPKRRHYQNLTMQDFERGGIVLLDLTYLADEFDIHTENEKGKPVRVTLIQKQSSPT